MPHDVKLDNPTDSSTKTTPLSHSSGSKPVPVLDYTGTHADDSTVKNPKTPESSGGSRMERAANKAAHKGAKDEQDAEKKTPIFSR